jgi:hypothetical protein
MSHRIWEKWVKMPTRLYETRGGGWSGLHSIVHADCIVRGRNMIRTAEDARGPVRRYLHVMDIYSRPVHGSDSPCMMFACTA